MHARSRHTAGGNQVPSLSTAPEGDDKHANPHMCEDMSVQGRPPRGMMKQGRERPCAKALRWYGGKKVHEAAAR